MTRRKYQPEIKLPPDVPPEYKGLKKECEDLGYMLYLETNDDGSWSNKWTVMEDFPCHWEFDSPAEVQSFLAELQESDGAG